MVVLVLWLLSILKAIALGRWYPPGYVKDVSTQDFNEIVDIVKEMNTKLTELGRQVDATQRKVYRDASKDRVEREVKEVVGGVEVSAPGPGGAQVEAAISPTDSRLSRLQSGDEVPAELL